MNDFKVLVIILAVLFILVIAMFGFDAALQKDYEGVKSGETSCLLGGLCPSGWVLLPLVGSILYIRRRKR